MKIWEHKAIIKRRIIESRSKSDRQAISFPKRFTPQEHLASQLMANQNKVTQCYTKEEDYLVSNDETVIVGDKRSNKELYATEERLTEAQKHLHDDARAINLISGQTQKNKNGKVLKEIVPQLNRSNYIAPKEKQAIFVDRELHLPTDCRYGAISVIGQRLTLQDFVGDNINENPEHFVWIRIKSLISRLPAEQRYSKLAEWLDLYKSLEVNRLALKDYQKNKVNAGKKLQDINNIDLLFKYGFHEIFSLNPDNDTEYIKKRFKRATHFFIQTKSRIEQEIIDLERDILASGSPQSQNVNEYANPSIGEAYAIVGGGFREGKGTWNWHWAAVIMNANEDNVTMESHAQNANHGTHNHNWDIKMYGPRMQSFHDYWKDSFGELPITFVGKSFLSKLAQILKEKSNDDTISEKICRDCLLNVKFIKEIFSDYEDGIDDAAKEIYISDITTLNDDILRLITLSPGLKLLIDEISVNQLKNKLNETSSSKRTKKIKKILNRLIQPTEEVFKHLLSKEF